jgi:rhodanese-related sulfurtransferase
MAGCVNRITPPEAQALLAQGWTYLDVRSEMEFEQGHPVGALNIPLMHAAAGGMTPNAEFLSVVEAMFAKDAKLIVGCHSGGRSQRAAQMLIGAGYSQLVEQRCGFGGTRGASGVFEKGWADSQLPVERGHPAGRSWRELREKAK